MTEMISGVSQTALQQQGPEKQTQQTTTSGDSKFEKTLQKTENTTPSTDNAPVLTSSPNSINQTNQALNDPRLAAIQSELIQNTQNIPQTAPTSKVELSPLFNELNGRMNVLREMQLGLKNVPNSDGILGFAKRTENLWGNVEAIMHSSKELRPGELLALQARMYMVSQHVDVMSKVVDQMTGGVKTILNTNV